MRLINIFNQAFLWRHAPRRKWLRTIISIQVVCMSAVLPVSLASAPAWKTYYDQGEDALGKAEPAVADGYFRKALSLAQNNSSSSQYIQECLMRLADTLAQENKTIEAQRLYKQLLGILVRKYGNSKQIVPVLLSLGSIQESLGDHNTAITYYERALGINEKNYGPYSPEFAANLHSLARANAHAGNKNKAEKQYKQTISILMKEPSLSASEQLKSATNDYSDLLKESDDSDKSLINDFKQDVLNNPSSLPQSTNVESGSSAWQKQTVIERNTSKQAHVNEDPEVVLRSAIQPWSQSALSPAYKIVNDSIVDQGRYEKGEDYYQRMIAIDIKALGPYHPSVADDLNGLAQFYIHHQDYAQAEPLLSRAYAIYQKTYGLDNLLTISTLASYALVEFHLNKIDKAEAFYQTALSHSQSTLGPNNFETARILNELAHLYFQQGKLQKAATYYKWALASTEAAVGQQSPLLAACLHDYARVLRGLGQSTEAAALESRADSISIAAK